jgi:hypothetical protein
MTKLNIIKVVHTLIWIFFNVVLLSISLSIIKNEIDKFVWIGIGCILIEWIVLLSFKWQCPLTILARKYSDSTKDNFDIFLPNWLAKYNKVIYITIFIVIIFGLIFRIFDNR